jgi:SAM-dependent methyltransferase
MTLDPRTRFTKAAALYARFRPSYPAAAIDWIIADARLGPGARVVDLGCGTGMATRLFAERGLDVVGVDPNEEMLAHARAAGGRCRYVLGEAVATGLGAGSADLVVAAQAFHWFDAEPTFAELRRILRPSGRVAALWNLRRPAPVTDGYERELLAHSPEYRRLTTHAEAIARLRAHPAVTATRETEIEHEEWLDWDRLLGRIESSSYVAHGVDDRPAFHAALRALFDRHAVSGRVLWPYRTQVVAFSLVN